jgi:hypothetical protein
MSIVGGEQVRASATRIAARESSTLSLHEIIGKTQPAKTPVSVLEIAEKRGVCVVMARPPKLLSRYVSSEPRRKIHPG